MRAIAFRQHDSSLDAYEYIADLPKPKIGSDEVLVRVSYAALNRLDNWVRIGWKGLNLEFPHIPCSDFSGEIAEIGDAVSGWEVGQAVTANPLIWRGNDRFIIRGEQNKSPTWHLLGETTRGSCAEFVKVPARNLALIPEGFDMQKAAAASLVYVTAWHNLMIAGGLRAGETVLVVGAGGGVNTAAIQIAKLTGAKVLVIASNAEKAGRAEKLGADWIHDRGKDENWSKAVFQQTNRQGVDMVVDNVGQATWVSSLRALRPGGRLVTVGGTSGYNASVPVNLIFAKHLSIIGSTMGTQDDYLTVMNLVFENKLDPVVDSIFAMRDFKQAMQRMLESEQFGKILIKVDQSQ